MKKVAAILLVAGLAFSCGGDDEDDSTSVSYCSGDATSSQVSLEVGTACAQSAAVGNNFYKFTTGDLDTNYTVTADGKDASSDFNIAIYTDDGYNTELPSPNTCQQQSAAASESCSAPLTKNTTYYVIIQNTGSAAVSFNLTVSKV